MALKKINKLYYSIGEVSKVTNLKQYVLRYWETEFPILILAKIALVIASIKIKILL